MRPIYKIFNNTFNGNVEVEYIMHHGRWRFDFHELNKFIRARACYTTRNEFRETY